MMERLAYSELRPFQTKYPCIICMERVKAPVKCLRCHSIICLSHVKHIDDRCPYCRLSPFAYEREKFIEELVQLDRKKQEEYLIETSEFQCLVQGCDFKGKYHKMDLHRRKVHRNQTLREIIFPQARQNGKKMRAVEQLLIRIRQRNQQQTRAYQLGLILHNRSRGRVDLPRLLQMIQHVDNCRHIQCKRVHAQEQMCFIGTRQKEISACMEAQRFMMFFQA